MLEPSRCLRHPDTETNLSCGRCEEPICPSCMVHTPVGFRCEDCARVRPPPTFDVTGIYLARAIGASVALGVAGGITFWILSLLIGGVSFWQAIAFAGIGYMVGEGISVAVNRKRGRRLKLVASGGVFLAYVVSIMTGVTPSTSMFLGLIVGFYVAIKRF